MKSMKWVVTADNELETRFEGRPPFERGVCIRAVRRPSDLAGQFEWRVRTEDVSGPCPPHARGELVDCLGDALRLGEKWVALALAPAIEPLGIEAEAASPSP